MDCYVGNSAHNLGFHKNYTTETIRKAVLQSTAFLFGSNNGSFWAFVLSWDVCVEIQTSLIGILTVLVSAARLWGARKRRIRTSPLPEAPY